MGITGWAAVADVLERITLLTSLNGCCQYAAIRAGGLVELRLLKEWDLVVWAARFLDRSASTLTTLDIRCAALALRRVWGDGPAEQKLESKCRSRHSGIRRADALEEAKAEGLKQRQGGRE